MEMEARAHLPLETEAWHVLERVPDPEIPVLSIVDLGIVRYVRMIDGALHVGLAPTYSGCPATEVIRDSVREALVEAGFGEVEIEEVLSPPWSSDWITEQGRRKLLAFGIVPPPAPVTSLRALTGRARTGDGYSGPGANGIRCPRCASLATQLISEFGSTPCKAHYRCTACLEPFDVFKCL